MLAYCLHLSLIYTIVSERYGSDSWRLLKKRRIKCVVIDDEEENVREKCEQTFLAHLLQKGHGLLSWRCISMQNNLVVLKCDVRIHKPVQDHASGRANARSLTLWKHLLCQHRCGCCFCKGWGWGVQEQFANLKGILVHCNLQIYSLRYLYGKLALKSTFETITNWFRRPQNVTVNLISDSIKNKMWMNGKHS